MKIKVIASLFLFLVACSTDDKYETIIVKEEEFNKDEQVIGEYVELSPEPNCPDDILIIDSLLIIKNGEMCNDDFFYVYNKKNGEFLESFGKRGRGPNEFLNVKMNEQYVKNDNSIKIWVHDREGFNLINLTRSIEENEIVIEAELLYESKEIHPILDAFILSSADIVGKSLNQAGRLFYYNNNKDSISWVEYFPKVNEPPYEEHMIDNLYIGPTKINPDNTRVVSALELFKRIDVFTGETEHLFSLVFEDSPKNPDFFINPNDPIPNSLMHYYYDLFLTEKYIYALNINISEGELNKGMDSGYSELHVFSWEGEPIALYRLNHLIYSITVDEEDNYLYGLLLPNEEESTMRLAKFELK